MISINMHSIVHTLSRIYSDVHAPCKHMTIHKVSRDSGRVRALFTGESVCMAITSAIIIQLIRRDIQQQPHCFMISISIDQTNKNKEKRNKNWILF